MNKAELEESFEALQNTYEEIADAAERAERVAYLDHLRCHQAGPMRLCSKLMCRTMTELIEAVYG